MLKMNLAPTLVIEGNTCVGMPNVVCSHSSFEKPRLYPKKDIQNTSSAAIHNMQWLPTATGCHKFNDV